MSDPAPSNFDFWQLVIAAGAGLASGSLALWRAAVMVGHAEGRIEQLERDAAQDRKTLHEMIARNDQRHEQNLKQFGLLGERIAGMKDDIVQRIEEMFDRWRNR